jgi:acetyl esterase/lipase
MPWNTLRFLLALFFVATIAAPAQTIVPLWDGPAPQSHGTTADDIPTLTVFLPQGATGPASAVIICPGGAYAGLSMEYEGTREAAYFTAKGVAAFVLKYRLPAKGYRHPVPLLDAQRAIRFVRSRAVDWKINPTKVGIMGFSAGGHLASTIDTHFDAGDPQAADAIDKLSCRPDFAMLVYPVISMQDGVTHPGSKKNLLGPNPDPALVANLSNDTQVTAKTPPTLLVDVLDDKTVPVENSRRMFAALQKAGVPSALQEYPTGGHGFGYGHSPDKSPPGWLDNAYDWVKGQGFFPWVTTYLVILREAENQFAKVLKTA